MKEQLTPKKHFLVLDGLRGVAAILVVLFHLLEAHATSHQDQLINHGYLAVDFFFLLSGYVIGYAYDDRWPAGLSAGAFIRRRLLRLHPLVILGSLVGAAFFYFQASDLWPMIAAVPVWKTLLIMLVGCTLLPIPVGWDIRGWQEMHPLNGPAWSLFFEYVANLLYVFLVRRFSTTALLVLAVLSAAALVHLTVFGPAGDVVGGWSLDAVQLRIGFTRVMYPFFAGLLLSRITRPGRIKHAFGWCSLLIVAVLAMPRIGGTEQLWMNGLYESGCILVIFPLIVYLGASESAEGQALTGLATFLGRLSYPLYITHYPLVYTYTAWVYNNQLSLRQAYLTALLVLLSAVVLAWLALKGYDEPVRKWLQRKTER